LQPIEWKRPVIKFEAQSIAQMSDSEWELYLSNAVVMFSSGHSTRQVPVFDTVLFRCLMNVLRQYVAEEEADLARLEKAGKDTKGHPAFDLRRLAHWATIQSYPVGSFLSERRYGVRPESL
jgi:primosomal protein N''